MRLQLQTVIKEEIEQVFGRRVLSSRDCIELSNEIYYRTQNQLNPNTLRRFFGLVKAEYPASQSTLTILSKYCGFYSVDEIYKLNKTNQDQETIGEEGLLHYLVSLFRETPVSEKHDKTFLSFVKQTISFLDYTPVLADKFQSLVAKTRHGQDYYFERFVNVDRLNSYYEAGLRHYLNEKRTTEANLFVNSILVYKHWLTGDDAKLAKYGAQIPARGQSDIANSYLECRYYAALLFQADVCGNPAEELLIDIYKLYSGMSNSATAEQLSYFEYVVSEGLILTGHYQDGLYYLSKFIKRMKTTDICPYVVSSENVRVLEAIGYYKTEDEELAEKIFDNIKPSGFHFLSRKFANTLYLYLASKLKRKNEKVADSFSTLIGETGFARLKKLS